jgi:hypothetical protein
MPNLKEKSEVVKWICHIFIFFIKSGYPWSSLAGLALCFEAF